MDTRHCTGPFAYPGPGPQTGGTHTHTHTHTHIHTHRARARAAHIQKQIAGSTSCRDAVRTQDPDGQPSARIVAASGVTVTLCIRIFRICSLDNALSTSYNCHIRQVRPGLLVCTASGMGDGRRPAPTPGSLRRPQSLVHLGFLS